VANASPLYLHYIRTTFSHIPIAVASSSSPPSCTSAAAKKINPAKEEDRKSEFHNAFQMVRRMTLLMDHLSLTQLLKFPVSACLVVYDAH